MYHKFTFIIKKVSFIAFKRDGIADFEKSYNRLIDLGADIKIIDDKITNISSTKLRNKISKEYLPPKIYDYIIEKGIYNG